MDQTTRASPRPPRLSARRAAFASGRLERLSPAGEATRAGLLRAAAEIFAEKGYAEASIDDVARRLGATKGLVYHHYRSKGDLYLDAAAWGLAYLDRAVSEAAAPRERAATRLKRMAEAHLAALAAEPAARHGRRGPPPMALARDAGAEAERLAALRQAYEARFHAMLEAARREGDAEAKPDAATACRALLAILDLPARGPPAEPAALALAALRAAGIDRAVLAEEFS
ncbi:hypothetical protein GCM10011390_36040 [Aureimonas endophytica]|uniref:HTH tetR-type domain-containing protein n=1 Tax=Aureimonas endophytica TaxID=2027858 RepID=A0A916ZUQ4_9HYPH|nr:TetR/AcrR family transcriptional regulator [Aureimonas endophytica]GGE13707.1 hypothetical protein GCM10011390_36040 [Aureimonas endophytica]